MAGSFFRRSLKYFFIVVNILTAIIFCLGCHPQWFPAEHRWLTGLFTLAAFYLFILLLIFFIGWIIVRSRWAFLFMIVFIFSIKQISAIVPFRFSSSFHIEKEKNAIRVMSWNVESFEILKHTTHPEEKDEMIDLINHYQPDIACFQEMTTADSSKTAFYHLDDFIKRLHFPYHYYAYNKLDDFYPGTQTHYGKIIFSKFPIINYHTIDNSPHDYNYTFFYVDVVKNTDTIRVFNLHLQTMKLNDDNLNYIDSSLLVVNKHDINESKGIITKLKYSFPRRAKQAEAIKNEINKSPYPVIVCGDFNDVPNSYAYETIGKDLQNAFEKKGAGLGRTFSEISPTLRIDNIFTDKKFSILQYVRIKKRLSDHYPIISDISLDHP